MPPRRRSQGLVAGTTLLVAVGVMLSLAVRQVSAAGSVSAVVGSAYGLRAYGITLFGGAQAGVGPKPSVTLQSNASGGPQSATASTGLVQFGPATLFTSDGISVRTTGSLGASGSVTSTSAVSHINKASTQTSTGSEPLTVGSLAGSCSASAAGTTGSTTITAGSLRTDSGLDINGDGNYTGPGEHPPVTVILPPNPRPNTTISGVVYTSATAKDSFHMVFNEQSRNAGQLTVNPVHEYFDGPILRGNLVIGQVDCGVTVVASTPASTSASTLTPAPATSTTSSMDTTSSSVTSSTPATATPSPASATPSVGSAAATGSPGGGGGRAGTVIAAAGGGVALVGLLAYWWIRSRRTSIP